MDTLTLVAEFYGQFSISFSGDTLNFRAFQELCQGVSTIEAVSQGPRVYQAVLSGGVDGEQAVLGKKLPPLEGALRHSVWQVYRGNNSDGREYV